MSMSPEILISADQGGADESAKPRRSAKFVAGLLRKKSDEVEFLKHGASVADEGCNHEVTRDRPTLLQRLAAVAAKSFVSKNCGTGDGGFKEGNTCGRGGDGPSADGDDDLKSWFGESKISDSDGSPILVHHGSVETDLEELDPFNAVEVGGAVFFTDSEDVASEYTYPREYGEIVSEFYNEETDEYEDVEPGRVYSGHLKILNPLVVDFDGDVGDASRIGKLVRQAKADGHDGLVIQNVDDTVGSSGTLGTSYVIFDSSQFRMKKGSSGSGVEGVYKSLGVLVKNDCGANAEGGGGFQPGNTCSAGSGGANGGQSRKPEYGAPVLAEQREKRAFIGSVTDKSGEKVSSKRAAELVKAAEGVTFDDEVYEPIADEDEEEVEFDEDTVRGSLDAEQEKELRDAVDEYKSDYMEAYESEIWESDAADTVDWGNTDVYNKVAELYEDEAAQTVVKEWWESSKSYGADAVDEVREKLTEAGFNIDAVDDLYVKAQDEVAAAVESLEQADRDSYYEGIDTDEFETQWLKNHFEQNKPPAASTEDTHPRDSWFQIKKETGDYYKFDTDNGVYSINVYQSAKEFGGLKFKVIEFADSNGDYTATGKAGAKASFQVFSNVSKAIAAYTIEKLKGSGTPVTFSANSESRQLIYERLARTITQIAPEYMAYSYGYGEDKTYLVVPRDKAQAVLSSAYDKVGKDDFRSVAKLTKSQSGKSDIFTALEPATDAELRSWLDGELAWMSAGAGGSVLKAYRAVFKNCGTGDGGFKEGNTCAKGDGGAAVAEHLDGDIGKIADLIFQYDNGKQSAYDEAARLMPEDASREFRDGVEQAVAERHLEKLGGKDVVVSRVREFMLARYAAMASGDNSSEMKARDESHKITSKVWAADAFGRKHIDDLIRGQILAEIKDNPGSFSDKILNGIVTSEYSPNSREPLFSKEEMAPVRDEILRRAKEKGAVDNVDVDLIFKGRKAVDDAVGYPSDDATDEERSEWFAKSRKARDEWENQVKRAISLSVVSQDVAKALGFHSSGGEKYLKTPETLWTVTTATDSVLASRLKTRDELNQREGAGLGGGASDTISFTDSKEIAHGIKSAMREAGRVARGEITVNQIVDAIENEVDIRTGEKLKSGFREAVNGSLSPGEVDSLLSATKRGEWNSQEMKRDVVPKTDDEKQYDAFSLYKKYAFYRENYGGPIDPLFFSSDLKALVSMPLEQVQIIEAKMRPEAHGYVVSSLGEWRVHTGDTAAALSVLDDDRPADHKPVVSKSYAMLFSFKGIMKSSGCGANAEGGGGFQPGNTCGKSDGAGGDAGSKSADIASLQETYDNNTTRENLHSLIGAYSEKIASGKFSVEESDTLDELHRFDYKQNGTKSYAFKQWFGDWEKNPKEASQAVDGRGRPQKTYPYSQGLDDDGKPIIVMHGTTHDFEEFDTTRGNPENSFGIGHYFTTGGDDVSENYAGVGPDLRNRISQLAEESADSAQETIGRVDDVIKDFLNEEITEDIERDRLPDHLEAKLRDEIMDAFSYGGLDFSDDDLRNFIEQAVDSFRSDNDSSGLDPEELAKSHAEKVLNGGEANVIRAYLNIRNPVHLNGNAGTHFDLSYRLNPDFVEEKLTEMVDSYVETVAEAGGDRDKAQAVAQAWREEADGSHHELLRMMQNPEHSDISEEDYPHFDVAGMSSVESIADEIDNEAPDDFSEEVTILRDAIESVASGYTSDYGDIDVDEMMGKIGLGSEESVSADNLVKAVRESNITDENGRYVNGQFVSEVFRELGFDGIVDHVPAQRFGMRHIDSDTKHYIVFEPTQIKAVDNEGLFSPSEKSFRKFLAPAYLQSIIDASAAIFKKSKTDTSDCNWKTINGARVCIDSDGNMKYGPEHLRRLVESASRFQGQMEQANAAAPKPVRKVRERQVQDEEKRPLKDPADRLPLTERMDMASGSPRAYRPAAAKKKKKKDHEPTIYSNEEALQNQGSRHVSDLIPDGQRSSGGKSVRVSSERNAGHEPVFYSNEQAAVSQGSRHIADLLNGKRSTSGEMSSLVAPLKKQVVRSIRETYRAVFKSADAECDWRTIRGTPVCIAADGDVEKGPDALGGFRFGAPEADGGGGREIPGVTLEDDVPDYDKEKPELEAESSGMNMEDILHNMKTDPTKEDRAEFVQYVKDVATLKLRDDSLLRMAAKAALTDPTKQDRGLLIEEIKGTLTLKPVAEFVRHQTQRGAASQDLEDAYKAVHGIVDSTIGAVFRLIGRNMEESRNQGPVIPDKLQKPFLMPGPYPVLMPGRKSYSGIPGQQGGVDLSSIDQSAVVESAMLKIGKDTSAASVQRAILEAIEESLSPVMTTGGITKAYRAVFKANECGANAPGGGGFQPGNTCGGEKKSDGGDDSVDAGNSGGSISTPGLLAFAGMKSTDIGVAMAMHSVYLSDTALQRNIEGHAVKLIPVMNDEIGSEDIDKDELARMSSEFVAIREILDKRQKYESGLIDDEDMAVFYEEKIIKGKAALSEVRAEMDTQESLHQAALDSKAPDSDVDALEVRILEIDSDLSRLNASLSLLNERLEKHQRLATEKGFAGNAVAIEPLVSGKKTDVQYRAEFDELYSQITALEDKVTMEPEDGPEKDAMMKQHAELVGKAKALLSEADDAGVYVIVTPDSVSKGARGTSDWLSEVESYVQDTHPGISPEELDEMIESKISDWHSEGAHGLSGESDFGDTRAAYKSQIDEILPIDGSELEAIWDTLDYNGDGTLADYAKVFSGDFEPLGDDGDIAALESDLEELVKVGPIQGVRTMGGGSPDYIQPGSEVLSKVLDINASHIQPQVTPNFLKADSSASELEELSGEYTRYLAAHLPRNVVHSALYSKTVDETKAAMIAAYNSVIDKMPDQHNEVTGNIGIPATVDLKERKGVLRSTVAAAVDRAFDEAVRGFGEGGAYFQESEDRAELRHKSEVDGLSAKIETLKSIRDLSHGVTSRVSEASTEFYDLIENRIEETDEWKSWQENARDEARSEIEKEHGTVGDSPIEVHHSDGQITVNSDSAAGELKDKIATDVGDRISQTVSDEEAGHTLKTVFGSDDTRYEYGPVGLANKFLGSWASSSTKSIGSLVLQESIRARFAQMYPVDGEIVDDAEGSQETRDRAKLLLKDPVVSKTMAAVVDAFYKNTQESLAESHYTIYRGMVWSDRHVPENVRSVLDGDTTGGVSSVPGGYAAHTTIRQNPISSWSTNYGIATQFAHGYSAGDGKVRAVVQSVVPKERIFSTSMSGPGCLNESEFVVLGGKAPGRVMFADSGALPMNARQFNSMMDQNISGSFSGIVP